ncbi:Activator of 90 kDa heat shock protein ATPase 1-like [Homarus americanus]|uniref:Activator of 90 kDa heat shock protein ATPase 1-like n=1 Tax=Homarus americanus TaxID=6706 RepID=A0A8J5MY99_HOMAM|nr:Activator of 90 kDa heat shock protein ATPase 1-like [Homarus americanus]
MAKWGEGDPRWIVEERPDATNVNNWHWSEKNAGSWSRITLKELTKCEGEATVSNRKGKLIFFYEWVLHIDWMATSYEDPKKDIKGTIEIPNLSEENDPDEIDVSVSLSAGGSVGDKIKEYLRKNGAENIREKIVQYVDTLKKEYATDLIKPTKGQAVVKQSKTLISPASVNNSSNMSVRKTTDNIEKMDLGCKIGTSKINVTQTFKCTADELYRAFTQREMVVAFTRGDVKLEVEKGGKFEFFGGNISGVFESLVPNKQIVQTWRFKSWPSGHYSTVTIDIEQKEDCTELRLSQSGIPYNEVDRTKEGWRNYYWESIKRTFGFGAILI